MQVETRLYQLLAQVKQIANEQSYQRVSFSFFGDFCDLISRDDSISELLNCSFYFPVDKQTREATFREISESTNVRVLWWSIAQGAVLVVTGYLQLQHLKGFFEAKKLV